MYEKFSYLFTVNTNVKFYIFMTIPLIVKNAITAFVDLIKLSIVQKPIFRHHFGTF